MMISKKDINKIAEALRPIIAEEIEKAHTRKLTVEYGPRKPGDPEKVIKEEEWNIMDWIVKYMPYIEGSMRGMQKDVNKTSNKIIILTDQTNQIGNCLMTMEDSAKKIAWLSDQIQNNVLLPNDTHKPLEIENK